MTIVSEETVGDITTMRLSLIRMRLLSSLEWIIIVIALLSVGPQATSPPHVLRAQMKRKVCMEMTVFGTTDPSTHSPRFPCSSACEFKLAWECWYSGEEEEKKQ